MLFYPKHTLAIAFCASLAWKFAQGQVGVYIFSSLSPFGADHLVKWNCNAVGSGQIELNVCVPARTWILASIEMNTDGRKVKEISHGFV